MTDPGFPFALRRASLFTIATLFIPAFIACDYEGDSPMRNTRDDHGAKLYALATRIESPENDALYLGTVSDLTAPFDLVANGIEIPRAHTFQAVERQVFVASDDTPTIARFVPDAKGVLQEDKTLNFADVGVTSTRDYTIISATKAYVFDFESYKAHVWNPSKMRLTGVEIDLSAARHDERGGFWLAPYRFDHVRRDNLLFIGGGLWPVGGPTHLSVVLVFDTDDDTVKVLEDDRCVSVSAAKQTENGDIFFFADPVALGIHQRAPCSLVIRSGETEFDPTYNHDFSEAVGGQFPVSFIQGPGDTVYVQVADAERIGSDEASDLITNRGNNFRLWQLDLRTNEATELAGLGYFLGARWPLPLGDGRALMAVSSVIDPEDESQGYQTEFYEVREQSEPLKFEFGDDSAQTRAGLTDIVQLL